MKTQKEFAKVFSCEFFPPRNEEAAGKLLTTQSALAALGPDFFSVTFGAGGSTRERTLETAIEINQRTGIDAAPHVSCIGMQRDRLSQTLQTYRDSGIRRVVALRGDMPSGLSGHGELRYASELVEFIRRETGGHFHIEVAAYPEFHPQAASPSADIENFRRKIDAGANSAITQYFYNPWAYFHFVDHCESLGVSVPIVPGVMPIINCTQLHRFSEGCGTEIPRWILKRLQEFGDDRKSIRAFGVDVVVELCHCLLENGAPGLHFYTLNQSASTVEIWNRLELSRFRPKSVARKAAC